MSNSARQRIGKEGELFAASYFEKLGYKIISQNYRQPFGELDLIIKDARQCLVFVEVKTMRLGQLSPEDQMSKAKLRKFKRTAEFFANAHPELITNAGWRIDVLTLTKTEKDYIINHYQNIA